VFTFLTTETETETETVITHLSAAVILFSGSFEEIGIIKVVWIKFNGLVLLLTVVAAVFKVGSLVLLSLSLLLFYKFHHVGLIYQFTGIFPP
jgi:hypothetical protein